MALPRTGGYAEAVAADWVVPLPDGATFAEGASFLMTFLTAWIPMRRVVEPGHDGARARGLGWGRVRGDAARARTSARGCTRPRAPRRSARGRSSTAPTRRTATRSFPTVDVIVDPVGGEVFAASLKALNPLGTLIAIGYAGGVWADAEPGARRRAKRDASPASTSAA